MAEEWEHHKDCIRRLWKEDALPLNVVVNRMKTEHDFDRK